MLQRVEFHYTPKHGSWLNMAEVEIAILERSALSRPWEMRRRYVVRYRRWKRNATPGGVTLGFQFTSRDARRKLERLYPVKEPKAD